MQHPSHTASARLEAVPARRPRAVRVMRESRGPEAEASCTLAELELLARTRPVWLIAPGLSAEPYRGERTRRAILEALSIRRESGARGLLALAHRLDFEDDDSSLWQELEEGAYVALGRGALWPASEQQGAQR